MPINNNEKDFLLALIKRNNLNIKTEEGWQNFSRNLDNPGATVFDIRDVTSLQQIICAVYNLNQTKKPADRILVRVAAGGGDSEYSQSFSFTPGSDADIVIRLAGNEFKKLTPVSGQKNIMSVGASMQIGDMDKELYDKYNLSLPTASLIPYVTVAGLSANAGHGTGKDQPAFAGLIRAMTLCLPNGNIIRIDSSHKDFETIRGAHLGLFGIVLNLEIECTEAKKMQCVMEARSIPEFLDEVKNGLFYTDPYVSAMYVPTYQKNELNSRDFKNVIVYRWRPVDKSVSNTHSHPVFSHIGQELEIKLEEGLHVTDLLREFPSIIPFYMRYLVSRASIGTKDNISVGPWYTVHYQTAFPWDIDDADYLFKVNMDSSQIYDAVKQIVTTLTENTKNHQYPLTDAVYVRLFAGTNGGLSTSQHNVGEHICGLDMVSSTGISGYEQFKENMQEYFINGELQAKPHWGKYVPGDVNYAKLYGINFTQFNDTLKNWYNDNGMQIENSMLLNAFFNQVLQLPYVPAAAQNLDLSKQFCRPVAAARLIASKMCGLIEDDNIHAQNFKKRLQAIAANKYKTNPYTLFQSACFNKQENAETKKEKQDKSCVIV